jgi:hypothetical protein
MSGCITGSANRCHRQILPSRIVHIPFSLANFGLALPHLWCPISPHSKHIRYKKLHFRSWARKLVKKLLLAGSEIFSSKQRTRPVHYISISNKLGQYFGPTQSLSNMGVVSRSWHTPIKNPQVYIARQAHKHGPRYGASIQGRLEKHEFAW